MKFLLLALFLRASAHAAPAEPEMLYLRQLFGARPAAPETAARAPRLSVRLDPADEEKLKSLFLAAKEASAAWQGFELFASPILLVQPGRGAVLIGTARAPKGFEPVPVAGRMVFVSKESPALEGVFQPDLSFSGVRAAALRYDPQDRTDQLVPFLIHERFHQYQKGWKQAKAAAYKAQDAEDLALASMEQEALARALESRDDQGLRDFIALRAYRDGRAAVRDVERREESREGTARYVDRRAAAEAFESSLGIPGIAARLREPLKPEHMAKWRFYATGAAMAYILERRGGPWQAQIENGAGPYDVLAEDVAMSPEEGESRTKTLLKSSAYAEALSAARLALEERGTPFDLALASHRRPLTIARAPFYTLSLP